MTNFDYVALLIFFVSWLLYEPILKLVSTKSGFIAKDLSIIRTNWMKSFLGRDVKIFDSNLLGHSINSASFFASANLLIIAAIAGAIFEGNFSTKIVKDFGISPFHLQLKLALVLICLSRGFLNFIWALRQMNYCAAAFGAIDDNLPKEKHQEYANALADIIEPAMSNFSQGVRGYYFALAAAAWLYGAWFLALGSLAALSLLIFRQSKSHAARGLKSLRGLMDHDNII